MLISALKEFTDNEKRVALTPDSLKLFQRLGLEVLIEKSLAKIKSFLGEEKYIDYRDNAEEISLKVRDLNETGVNFRILLSLS